MPDPSRPRRDAPDAAATTELALADRGGPLPEPAADRHDGLPGLEPERNVTDWGRSERISSLADATVLGFLYHYWFRVEADGVSNVPERGGALLVANRAGHLRLDALMVARAVREEQRGARPVHLVTGRTTSDVPGIGMLATKLGVVGAHPANLHRLLFDERQVVLTFPESDPATTKPLHRRYRLRRFQGIDFVECAMRARVPIVPVAVLGGEEATPTLATVAPIRRLALPLTTPLPLPAKFRVRFLQPVRTDAMGERPWEDRAEVSELAEDIRCLIQENLLEMVAERRSVWLG